MNEAGHEPIAPEPIAIVGMSCLFPGAPDLDAYWANILGKVDGVRDAPADAWDPRHHDPDFADTDKVYTRRGGYLGELATFDPLPHGIPPVAVGGEPDQWLALQLARDALADADCLDLPAEVRARTGVVLGKGTYLNGGNAVAVQRSLVVEQTLALVGKLRPDLGPEQVELLRADLKAQLPPLTPETVAGLIPNVIVGRIANRLDLMGPTYTVDAACASSLIAVQLAVRDLRSGECDVVVAGGSQVWMPVPALNVFCRLGALSRTGSIRPFDAAADGTLLGEGIGMVVLKRLADARRDGNRVYAVVRGVGVASDGRGTAVMAPLVEGEELALRRAYADAGVDPATVGLVEAHGTATPVGDVVEIEALRRVFGGRRGALGSVALGSVKSMISHTIPAAGVAGIIKTALALHHKVLPPTLNVTTPNPRLGLDRTPFYLNTETRPWVGSGTAPRRAGVNAFGFGGINAHAVLEEVPPDAGTADADDHAPAWDSELVVVEAVDRAGLVTRTQSLLHRLRGLDGADVALVDVAATLAARVGSVPSPVRLAVVAADLDELVGKLERALVRLSDPSCTELRGVSGTYFAERPLGRSGTLAFLFPGEGSQYVGMLGDLFLRFPEVREAFERAARRSAPEWSGPDGSSVSVAEAVFPPPAFTAAETEAAESRLVEMQIAIDAVLTANDGLLALTRRLGITPTACAGHSSGEYSAAAAAGLLAAGDEGGQQALATALHGAYAAASEAGELATAALFSLGTDRETAAGIAVALESAGSGPVRVAMDNCPHQVVVVCPPATAPALLAAAAERSLVCEPLAYDRAVHTAAFDRYADRLHATLDPAAFRPPSATLWSCATGTPYPADLGAARSLFAGQWATPVEFAAMIRGMWESGTRVFLEVGPRGNLSAFVDDILRGRDFCAVPLDSRRRSGTRQLNLAVGQLVAQGVPLDLSALFAGRRHRIAPDLPDPTVALPVAQRSASRRPLATGWPDLTISPAVVEQLAPRPDPSTRANLLVSPEVPAAQGEGPPAPAAYRTPLLGEVVAAGPGWLRAERPLDLLSEPSLRDHCFGGAVSVDDPELVGFAPVPLTLSLEILAEAAVTLVPGLLVVGLRAVRAHRWVAVDDEPHLLETTAERYGSATTDGSVEVAVRLRLASDPDPGPAVEAVVVLAAAYPDPPAPRPDPTTAPSRWAAADLYGPAGMFHGRRWQGVAAVHRTGPSGLTATLRPPSAAALPRGLVLDPVLLDAAGQLVGFWAAEHLDRGAVVFPVGLDTLTLYGPPPAGEVEAVTRTTAPHPDVLVSDLDLQDPDGRPWLRVSGWADKRIEPPGAFADLLRADLLRADLLRAGPAEVGITLALPATTWPGVSLRRVRTKIITDRRFWAAVWSARLLGRAERRRFAARTDPWPSRLDHLAGRAAVKETLRTLAFRDGLLLRAADIMISSDVAGRPVVHWDGPPVRVSLAHSGGTAVAAVSTDPDWAVGVDVEHRGTPSEAFAAVAFDPLERALLQTGPADPDRALRFWCAKEAAAKAAGTGLCDGPGTVTVVAADDHTGQVHVALHGAAAAALPTTPVLTVDTWVDDQDVLALTCAPAPAPARPPDDPLTTDEGHDHDRRTAAR